MINHLFPTTTVGSMPRPQYIKDMIEYQTINNQTTQFQNTIDRIVPFIIEMQDQAGIDIISDGEWRRKSYIGVIADICSGFELTIRNVNGENQTWHTVTSKMIPKNPGLFAREASTIKKYSKSAIKVALPSPYLIAERMWDKNLSSHIYPTRKDFTENLIPILRQELIKLRDEGVSIAQFDDPHLCLFVDPKIRSKYKNPELEIQYSIDVLNRIVEGIDGIKLALHLCRRNKGRSGWIAEGGYLPIIPFLNNLKFDMIMFEFTIPVAGDESVFLELDERFDIGLGCVDCRGEHIDTPEEIVSRVEKALQYVTPERITLHPDCGFAPGSAADIPIDEAFSKISNEVKASMILRSKYQR
tara:strand:- start:578 stop:1648 length:1071 start_codon:yes stop_codon:yes gene_type:complete